MIIIPAIDLLDGKVVRLKQGQYSQKTVYNKNSVAQAVKFIRQGAQCLHLIDLDGARTGQMRNLNLILQIRKKVKISLQAGGGIRNQKQIEILLGQGINRVILGTKALTDQKFLCAAIKRFGAEKIMVSLDVKNNQPMIKGWTQKEDILLDDLLAKFKLTGLQYLIYTDILKDGMMSSPNFAGIEKIKKYGFKLIASGGVSSLKDIKQLQERRVYGCIVGTMFYTFTPLYASRYVS